jgi:hypothetical protein
VDPTQAASILTSDPQDSTRGAQWTLSLRVDGTGACEEECSGLRNLRKAVGVTHDFKLHLLAACVS